MTNINLTSTSDSGFLETDFDQIKECLEDGTKDINTGGIVASNTSTTDITLAVTVPNTNTSRGAYIKDASEKTVVDLIRSRASGNGSNLISRDLASSDTAGPVLLVKNANSSDNQKTMEIEQNCDDIGLFIDQNGDGQALVIDSEASSATCATITTEGTGTGLYVDQNGDGYGIHVTTSATTKPSFYAKNDAETNTVQLGDLSDATGTNWFYRNVDSDTSAGPVVSIEQDNSGDDQNALNIQQDGTGVGIDITSNNTGRAMLITQNGNKEGIKINSFATSIGNYGLDAAMGSGANAIRGWQSASDYAEIGRVNTSAAGSNLFFRDLASSSTAGPVVFIEQDNAGDDQNALNIQNDGTGNGLLIDQNGNGIALDIESEATTRHVFRSMTQDDNIGSGANIIDVSGDTVVELVRSRSSSHGSNYFKRDLDSESTAGPVVKINQDNAGDDQQSLLVQQDGTGTGVQIDQNGDGTALIVDTASTTQAPLRITNLASDPTGAHVIGDIAVVAGKLKICTSAGTPGTWTVVGDQTAS